MAESTTNTMCESDQLIATIRAKRNLSDIMHVHCNALDLNMLDETRTMVNSNKAPALVLRILNLLAFILASMKDNHDDDDTKKGKHTSSSSPTLKYKTKQDREAFAKTSRFNAKGMFAAGFVPFMKTLNHVTEKIGKMNDDDDGSGGGLSRFVYEEIIDEWKDLVGQHGRDEIRAQGVMMAACMNAWIEKAIEHYEVANGLMKV